MSPCPPHVLMSSCQAPVVGPNARYSPQYHHLRTMLTCSSRRYTLNLPWAARVAAQSLHLASLQKRCAVTPRDPGLAVSRLPVPNCVGDMLHPLQALSDRSPFGLPRLHAWIVRACEAGGRCRPHLPARQHRWWWYVGGGVYQCVGSAGMGDQTMWRRVQVPYRQTPVPRAARYGDPMLRTLPCHRRRFPSRVAHVTGA